MESRRVRYFRMFSVTTGHLKDARAQDLSTDPTVILIALTK